MRIEITIEGQEPVVFKLAQSQTVFGSAPDCDLVVEAQGVAPHHLSVQMEGEQFFVMDLGSDSGSFMNDAHLMPGQRAEFTSFFPVHLGPVVTLALLSDEEEVPTFDFAQDLPKEPAAKEEKQEPIVPDTNKKSPTRTIETSLNIRRTPPMPKSRKKEGPSKKAKAPDEGSQTKIVQLLAFLVAFGGAGVFYFTRNISDIPVASQAVEESELTRNEPPSIDLADVQLEFERPLGLELAQSSVTAQKCFGPDESELCKMFRLPTSAHLLSGALTSTSSLVLVLPLFSREELMAHWPDITWPADFKTIPDAMDQRDIIATFLLHASLESLGKLSQERSWIYVSLVDQMGQSDGSLWVANLTALKTTMAAPMFLDGIRNGVSVSGNASLAPLAGFFRRID